MIFEIILIRRNCWISWLTAVAAEADGCVLLMALHFSARKTAARRSLHSAFHCLWGSSSLHLKGCVRRLASANSIHAPIGGQGWEYPSLTSSPGWWHTRHNTTHEHNTEKIVYNVQCTVWSVVWQWSGQDVQFVFCSCSTIISSDSGPTLQFQWCSGAHFSPHDPISMHKWRVLPGQWCWPLHQPHRASPEQCGEQPVAHRMRTRPLFDIDSLTMKLYLGLAWFE